MYTSLLKFSVLVNNIYMEGTVSQILIVGPSFYFMTKKGNFLTLFSTIFSTLHCTKPLSTIQCNKTLCRDQLVPILLIG